MLCILLLDRKIRKQPEVLFRVKLMLWHINLQMCFCVGGGLTITVSKEKEMWRPIPSNVFYSCSSFERCNQSTSIQKVDILNIDLILWVSILVWGIKIQRCSSHPALCFFSCTVHVTSLLSTVVRKQCCGYQPKEKSQPQEDWPTAEFYLFQRVTFVM